MRVPAPLDLFGEMMINAWTVYFIHEGKKKYKIFEGEKPSDSGAIAFGKNLQRHGIKVLGVCSRRKGFNKPRGVIIPKGLLWCPYCLKPREFAEFRYRRRGMTSALQWRCPICYISIKDAHVRRNNPEMVLIYDSHARSVVPSEEQIKRAVNRR